MGKAGKAAGRAMCAFIAGVLAMGIAGAALVGCASDGAKGGSGSDEIVLTVSKRRVDMIPQTVLDEMTKRHPNLRFEYDTYPNGNYSTQQVRELEQHDTPDILVNTRNQNVTEDLEDNLVDLAAYDFTSEYLPSIIDRLSFSGHVYYVPSYLTLAGFFYNKDMFAEHGWEAPQSLEDLVALNEQAKAEGIRLMAYSMELPGSRFLHLTDIAGAQFLHTPQGSEWEQGFLSGETTMAGTFEPYMDEYQTWIDSGLITADDLSLTLGQSEDMLKNGEVAMIYGLGNTFDPTKYDFEVGQAPFLAAGNGQDNGWYLYSTGGYYGISKKLEEPGNEEKLAIAIEMLEFMSTPEGQALLVADGVGRYPSTKATSEGFDDPLFSDYRDVIDRNSLVEFATYSSALTLGGEVLGKFVEGDATAAEALQVCDDALAESKSESQMGDVLAHIDRDMTQEETTRYFAEAFRDYKGTDLALMVTGGKSTGQYTVLGVAGKLYEGDLHANELTVLLPYTSEHTSVATAKITGAQLRSALEEGMVFDVDKWTGDDPQPFHYEVAGADVTYDENHKVTSLKVNDKDVADADTFTVTYFDTAVDAECLTDVNVTDESPIPAITAYFEQR